MCPPVGLEVKLDPNRPRRIELYGRIDAVVQKGGTVVLARRARGEAKWRDRQQLHGFLNLVVLSAAGLLCTQKQHVYLLNAGPPAKSEVQPFQPFSQQESRAYLASLLTDMLSGVHDYFLPFEVASLFYKNQKQIPLHVCMEQVRQSGRSMYGPVPQPEKYPFPSEAKAMIERRYGLFFSKRLEK